MKKYQNKAMMAKDFICSGCPQWCFNSGCKLKNDHKTCKGHTYETHKK